MYKHKTPRYVTAVFSRRTRIPLSITKAMTSGDSWSHCGVLIAGFVYEALMFKGVVATPYDEWKKRYPAYEEVKVACPDPAAAEEFVKAQKGKGYDYLGAFGAPWRSSWQDEDRWYCSELFEAGLKKGGRARWRDDKLGVRPMESYQVL